MSILDLNSDKKYIFSEGWIWAIDRRPFVDRPWEITVDGNDPTQTSFTTLSPTVHTDDWGPMSVLSDLSQHGDDTTTRQVSTSSAGILLAGAFQMQNVVGGSDATSEFASYTPGSKTRM